MRGKVVPLSAARRLICDLLHAASMVPTVPVQRRMQLGELVLARASHPARPSWPAIFTRAYSRVAQALPVLRRAYVKLPWSHLYEYPTSIASVALERDYEGEHAVFVARIKDPAALSLSELSERIRHYQQVPVEECRDFRRALRISRLPQRLRRAIWWLGLNWGRQRSNYFGTFGLSVYSALGAESLHPLSPSTTTLTYGVISPKGEVDARLVYDHRVMDGADVARALAQLESELLGATLAELRGETLPQKVAA